MDPRPETTPKPLRRALLTCALGTLMLLTGFASDAMLHARDPELAASEGILTLAPAHLLTVFGVALVTLGIGNACWLTWLRNRSRGSRFASGAVAGLVAVGTVGAVAVSADAERRHSRNVAAEAPAPRAHPDASAGGEDAAAEGSDDEPAEGSAMTGHGHVRDYAALWNAASPEQRAAAGRLVETTRAATRRYADYAAAEGAGYRPSRHDQTTHYPNPALGRDRRVLDPAAPETLVYWAAPDGRRVLVGVVYKAAPGQAAPALGGGLTAWHTHPESGHRCYPATDPGCPQHTAKMLHVFFFGGVKDPFAESMYAAAGGRDAFHAAIGRFTSS